MATPTTLKLSEIAVVKDFNPRTTMDKEQLDELAKSIKEHGLIQPIVVGEKNEKGKHPLVAGHRRYAALKQNRAKEAEVKILSVNGNAKAIAVTENLQREQVNPVDEAKGFAEVMQAEGLNQKSLAERLGISTSQVSDRLKLLKLPETAQEEIARGTIPTSAAALLAKIDKVSPPAASCATALLASKTYDATRLASHQEDVNAFMRQIGRGLDESLNCWVNLTTGVTSSEIYTDDLSDQDLAIVVDADVASDDWGSSKRPQWNGDDVEAAKAYGCLIEVQVPGAHRPAFYATDRAFVIDRLKMKLDRYEQAKADREKAKGTQAPSVEDEKSKRAAAREEQRVARLAAHAFNEELHRNLIERMRTLDVTLERMRTICLILAHSEAGISYGRTLVDEEQNDFEQKFRSSDGQESIKVTPIPKDSAREMFISDILEAESPEELMAILFEAIVIHQVADFKAFADKDAYGYHWPVPTGRWKDPRNWDPTLQIKREALAVIPEARRSELEEQISDMESLFEPEATAATDDELTDVDRRVRAEAAAEAAGSIAADERINSGDDAE